VFNHHPKTAKIDQLAQKHQKHPKITKNGQKSLKIAKNVTF
jgi:hypothetical protein